MAHPEHLKFNCSPHSSKRELVLALIAIERRLETVNENENIIERCFMQDRLEELKIDLQEELDSLPHEAL